MSRLSRLAASFQYPTKKFEMPKNFLNWEKLPAHLNKEASTLRYCKPTLQSSYTWFLLHLKEQKLLTRASFKSQLSNVSCYVCSIHRERAGNNICFACTMHFLVYMNSTGFRAGNGLA